MNRKILIHLLQNSGYLSYLNSGYLNYLSCG
jgi:hypothetical protein